MGRVKACRVCLNTDVKMERIQGALETSMKSVFGHNVLFSSDLPDYCCYECTGFITKFSKFRKKYFMAQSLLFNILQTHGVVTEKEIKEIDRSASKLSSNLIITPIEEHTQFVELKIECDPMEDVPDVIMAEELDSSGSDDDSPINSQRQTKHVNEKSKKQMSPLKKKMNREHDIGESSNKTKKLNANDNRKSCSMKGFDVTKLTERAGANGVVYLQAEDFDSELPDMGHTDEEYIPSSELSIQILENQNIMMSNQHSIISTLADISARFDTLKTTTELQQPLSINYSCLVMENKQQLDEFENNLNDPEKKKEFQEKYLILILGSGSGMNCAYLLVDAMFSRKFMTEISWAGGTRSEGSKIPMKIYKNTLFFFYELVHKCDSSFSLLDCYTFFKIILRNSKKRCESKGLRMSTQKRRMCLKHRLKMLRGTANEINVSENIMPTEITDLQET